MDPSQVRYSAFISYNHADYKWAGWLHRELETYRIPKHLQGRNSPVGVLGARLLPVYQDREEMVSSPDLAESVRIALEASATLIVLCSPSSAKSLWVNAEIRTFHALGRKQAIHCVIVDGEPHASHKLGFDATQECFPPALRELGLNDPVAPDVRPGTDGKQTAKLRLLAGMLGIGFDELRQREAARRQRRLMLVTAASLLGLVLTSGLAIYALIQRDEAVVQRDIARQKTLTAERTVDFVKSIFEVADPSEAEGASISAREVLDQSERRLAQSLNDEPNVKAELMITLGEVYGGLGFLQKSDRLIRDALAIPNLDRTKHPNFFAALGESKVRIGEYEQAIGSFQQGLAFVKAGQATVQGADSRLLVGLSEAQSGMEQYSAADQSAKAALAIAQAASRRSPTDIASAVEAIADNAYFQDKMAVAEPLFVRATNIRAKVQGNLHPKVLDNLNTLGSIAYLKNDPKLSENYFRRVLKARAYVLGPEHPNVATALNNLARVLLEQRKFSEVSPMLDRSVAITLKQRSETHDDMAFLFSNRAIAKHGLGNFSGAEADFRKALTAARLHKHRNLAPILTDLAGTLCDQRRVAEAMPLLDEAAPIMVKTYPDDPWRSAWVVHTRGRCLIASGKPAEAAALIRTNAKPLMDRWGADTLYGHVVRRDLQRARP
jgi:tetratricopeptide (TPR) repeat protein